MVWLTGSRQTGPRFHAIWSLTNIKQTVIMKRGARGGKSKKPGLSEEQIEEIREAFNRTSLL